MAGPITTKQPIRRTNLLRDATVRDFSGGWNEIDNDLNLSTKFSKKLQNLQLRVDGSIGIRYGTKLFAVCEDYLDEILNIEYFAGYIIAVGKNGKIVRVDSTGNVVLIWDDEWASKLPGSPSGWSDGLRLANFTTFQGKLIIVNGVNKPIVITQSMVVSYLVDAATGSNVNAPITKYVRAHSRYVVFAGDPLATSTIYITNQDSIGTFYGDPAPNDAVNVNLGSRVPSGNTDITGLGRYRDQLVVTFNDCLLPGTLGVYDGSGNHVPTFDDAIEEHGSISHRAIANLGDNMLFADHVGVPSITRALFTGSIRPQRESSLVDPAIQKQIGKVGTVEGLERGVFGLYDSLQGTYMLFVPDDADDAYKSETRGFIYKKQTEMKIQAWSEFTHWNWSAACKSALRRLFFSRGARIYLYGDKADEYFADYIGEQETFSDGTTFGDQTGWTPVADELDSGVPIKFVWELPWTDQGSRFITKNSRYLSLDTIGEGEFSVSFFIDKIYEDTTYLGEEFTDGTIFTDDTGFLKEKLAADLMMEFIGGSSPGFGGDGYGQRYGSGRPSGTEKLYAWTTKAKITKFRIEGETSKELRFVSITHGYLKGNSPRR